MRSLLVALILLCATASVHAQTFQWESLGIADEAVIPSGTVAGMGCGALTVNLLWSSVTSGSGSFVPFAGTDFISYESGLLGNHPGYLNAGFDNADDDENDVITIRFLFNQPVVDLAFSLTDIDTGSWDDGVEVFYNFGTNTKGSAFVSFSTPPVFSDNETYMEGYEGGGTSVASTSAAGNVDFDFGAGGGVAVTELEFTYRSTDDANSNPGGQLIGITDLDFNCDNPTPVLITDVRQMDNGHETWVEWDTAWQSSTAGYFVYRWDTSVGEYVPVHSDLVSAVGRPSGGVFAALDPSAVSGQDAWYLIEEVRGGGESGYYGPFLAEPVKVEESTSPGGLLPGKRESGYEGVVMASQTQATWSRDLDMDPGELERLSAALVGRPASARNLAATTAGVSSFGAQDRFSPRLALKLEVNPGSVVGVSVADLAAAWGTTTQQIERLLDRGRLRLRHNGGSVRWTVDGDRLVFYAFDEEPKFAYTTNYWLTFGSGQQMGVVKAGTDASSTPSTVKVKAKSEVDVAAVTGLAHGSEDDLYFWQLLNAADPNARTAFSVEVDQRLPNTPLELTLEATGVVLPSGGGTHRVTAFVGDTELGELRWLGDKSKTTTLEVPANVLAQSSINSVDFSLAQIGGASGNVAFVDSLSLGYQRPAIASNGALKFEALATGPVTIAGFSQAGPLVLDVTDERSTERLLAKGTRGNLGLRVEQQRRYVVVDDQAIEAPLAMTSVVLGGAWRSRRGAEYVVIAPRHLLEGARALANFRSEYSSLVVPAEELYDVYAGGAQDPEAIREFLKVANRRWQTKPRFVVLIGGASYDRKNLNGLDENVLPTFLERTPHGLFASDVRFADLDGDRVPDLALGRVPAVSNAEVAIYVRKLQEQSPPAGGFRASLLADNADHAGNFAGDSTELLGRFEASAEVGVNGYDPARGGDFVAQLEADYAEGLHWSNYFGHGGVDRMAAESLIQADQLGNLTGAYLPTVTALSCQIGRFEFPGHLSLAEALVLEDGAGAVAVWGAAGLSQHAEAKEIADAFISVHGASSEFKLGEAIQATLERYAAGSPIDYVQTLYSLFGDPAIDSPLTSAPVAAAAVGGKDAEGSSENGSSDGD